MHTKQNAPHHPKAMESAALSKLHSATTMRAVNRLALAACTTVQARATVRHGARHTMYTAGNLPDSEVFSRPEFSNAALRRVHGFGAGSAYPQGRQHGCVHVSIPSPTQWSRQPKGGFQSHTGAETMTTSPVASRCAAPTHQAAPAIPHPAHKETQAHALLQATISASLAGFYLRRDNIAQARRKLRQALQALQTLEVPYPTITKGITA